MCLCEIQQPNPQAYNPPQQHREDAPSDWAAGEMCTSAEVTEELSNSYKTPSSIWSQEELAMGAVASVRYVAYTSSIATVLQLDYY